MQYVYIVLSAPPTVPAKAIAAFTNAKYSHVSICFEENLQEFYSFGRLYRWFVIPGGFINEGCEKGCFGYWPHTQMCALRLEVTDEQLSQMKKRLQPFLDNPKKYKYALFNIVTQMFNKPYKGGKRYTCASFAAYILQNALSFKTDYSLVRPEDFLKFDLEKIYEGEAGDYTKFYNGKRMKEGN